MEPHNSYFLVQKGNIPLYWSFLKNMKQLNDGLINKLKRSYKKEIDYIQNNIREFSYDLKKDQTYENTIIIITSDHGQLFGEKNRYNHGTFLEEELLSVPLQIKYPNIFHNFSNKTKGYITLANISKFIKNIISNNDYDETLLYEEIIYSESFGIHQELYIDHKKLDNYSINKYDKHFIYLKTNKITGLYDVEGKQFIYIKNAINTLNRDEMIDNYYKDIIKRHFHQKTLNKLTSINK